MIIFRRLLLFKQSFYHTTKQTRRMSIKEKFERGIYSLKCIPRILDMDVTGIYINKNGLYPSEVDSLEDMDWERDKVLTPKLKATSYGDWQFHIGMINAKHFESREKLDEMFVDRDERTSSEECKHIERISMQKALDLFGIEFSCDMNWYLKNRNTIEDDTNRQVSNFELTDENSMKKLEEELFYNEMCKLFGETEDDQNKPQDDHTIYEKSFIIKDFHILLYSGNYIFASGQRGNYYLLFRYVY